MKKLFLLVGVSFALMVFLVVQWTGIRELSAAFLSINPLYLPLIILLQFALLAVYGLRWRLLLGNAGVKAGWRVVFKYVFIGAALNNITPMVRFGGEPVKGYMLAREASVRKRVVFAAITTDSFITAISLLTYVFFGFLGLLVFSIFNPIVLYIMIAAILSGLMICLYAFYNESLLAVFAGKLSRLVSRFSRERGEKLAEGLLGLRREIGKSLRRKDVILKAILLGFAERFLEVIAFYTIFLSMGVGINLYFCAIVLGVGLIFGLIPLLPGGLVAYESSSIIVLRLMGVSPALAATSVLLWRGANYWMITVIGLVIGWWHGVRFALRKHH